MRTLRNIAAHFLVILGVTAASVANITWWVSHSLLDAQEFSRTASDLLEVQEVQEVLASEIVQKIGIGNNPENSASLTSQAEAAIRPILASEVFSRQLEITLEEMHRSLLGNSSQTGDTTSPSVSLIPVHQEIQTALENLDPRLAEAAKNIVNFPALVLPGEDPLRIFSRAADIVRTAPPISLFIAVTAFFTALCITTNRPRVLRGIGLGLLLTVFIPLTLRFLLPFLVTQAAPNTTFTTLATESIAILTRGLVRQAILIGLIGLLFLISSFAWRPLLAFLSAKQNPHSPTPHMPLSPPNAQTRPPQNTRTNTNTRPDTPTITRTNQQKLYRHPGHSSAHTAPTSVDIPTKHPTEGWGPQRYS